MSNKVGNVNLPTMGRVGSPEPRTGLCLCSLKQRVSNMGFVTVPTVPRCAQITAAWGLSD